MPEQPIHYRIFDCWRFAAALLVMAYHYLFFAPGTDAPAATDFLHRLLPLLDMFFMISGFLIMTLYAGRMNTVGDYGRFLRRRLARLYPLHVLTLLFFAAVAAAGAGGILSLHDPQRWTFRDVPLHLLAIHAWGTTDHLSFNYPSWSVSAEIFCYLLFPVVVVVARLGGTRALIALLLAWVALLEVLSRAGVFPSGHWTNADTLGAYRAFADFTAGAVAACLVARRAFPVRSHLPGLLSLALALAMMIAQGPVYPILALLFLAILLVGLSETARPRSTAVLAPLMVLTRVSFGIYILHSIPEIVFLSFGWRRVLEPAGSVGFYTWLLVPMLATIGLALLSHRFVEGRLGRLLSGGRKPASPDLRLAGA
ncbi:acyltransferase [Aureimonas sp. AU4]|uniref:acyltransferase family protein n=1 Tax=Aureimonas sp. AU4 TaxID=1638163 RepID=UPI000A5413DF|nr:acyltransferase [Aureimonas sp. AU4]